MTGVEEGGVSGKVTEWPHSKYNFNDFSGAIIC